MSTEEIQQLLDAYVTGVITPADRQLLLSSLQNPALSEAVKDLLQQDLETARYEADDMPAIRERLQKRLAAAIETAPTTKPVKRLPIHRLSWLKYAAAIVLIAGAAGWFWFSNQGRQKDRHGNMVQVTEVQPGTNKAVLTVDNKTMQLADNKAGIVVQNKVTYAGGESLTDAGQWLQVVTPRGGQYQVVLPDGTKAWLNAASSIRFPSKFVGGKREISITGEVYLEVAKDKTKPFIVDVDGRQTVEVLGTHFNINSYANEDAMRTTLLEGKVKVSVTQPETSDQKPEAILSPGEQAELTTNNKLQTTNKLNVEQIIAWKNGLFIFDDASLKSVMHQISRWYDVEVVFDQAPLEKQFVGEIGREVPLSKVLHLLELTKQVHFTMSGKKLIVTR